MAAEQKGDNVYNLSPSKINLLKECPRCFYDANISKISRPRGIFPSLPGGMDLIFKTYYDSLRGVDIPMELKAQIPEGWELYNNAEVINKWRNWRTGLSYTDINLGVTLIGALDECLYNPSLGLYAPLDYKTKGSEPKDDGSQYYQNQINFYGLLLSKNGYEIADFAFLAYYYPMRHSKQLSDEPSSKNFTFGCRVFKIACSVEGALALLTKAVDCLNGQRPESSPACEQCSYVEKIVSLKKGAQKK